MNAATKSIYQIGGSLPANSPSYVQRQADKQLYDWLKAREFCYVLNSRQMGKSSLQVRTMRRLQVEGIACAEIDLTEIGGQKVTPQQWYGGFIRLLVNNFKLSERFNWRTWWQDRESLSPVQCLAEFIEQVLLAEVSQQIVIFIDEIDNLLELDFKDDFFALIRACYNNRAKKQAYKGLTFALLGVATPYDLIEDRIKTPFNIGKAVDLSGFELEQVQPLAKGLQAHANRPQVVLEQILSWTGGQPFLTQKLCQLVVDSGDLVLASEEREKIEIIVRKQIISTWKMQPEFVHFQAIRDRIISNEKRAFRLLALYKEILETGVVLADDSREQTELRLSGLVVKKKGKLIVYNRIYEAIFNPNWIENELGKLRPYAEAMAVWQASEGKDKSCLLLGRKLQELEEWQNGRSLAPDDYKFLSDCKDRNREIAQRYKSQLNTWLSGGQEKSLLLHGQELQETLEWASGDKLDKEDDKLLTYSIAWNLSGVAMVSASKQQEFQKILEDFKEKLANKATRHYAVIQQVILWTERHLLLTKSVFNMILDSGHFISAGEEEVLIKKLVQTSLIETCKDPEVATHLEAIRYRLINPKHDSFFLLWNYCKILNEKPETGEFSSEQQELLKLGLVAYKEDGLRVYNRIYKEIFNQDWVDRKLKSLRPYATNLIAWLDSGCRESKLLRGEKLQEAMEWIDNYGNEKVNKLEDQFIIESIAKE